MTDEIAIEGVTYISSKKAAEMSGYAQDYVGQLARGEEVDAKRIGGLWYISPESLKRHKEEADTYVPEPPHLRTRGKNQNDSHSVLTFSGRQYISSKRASEITGYSQDYVGQLARSEKIESKQIGSRWYVSRQDLLRHKKHNDELLAAVQADAVGLKPLGSSARVKDEVPHVHTMSRYLHEERDFLPRLREKPKKETPGHDRERQPEDAVYKIPVHIQRGHKMDGNAPVSHVAHSSHHRGYSHTAGHSRPNDIKKHSILSVFTAFIATIVAILLVGGAFTMYGTKIVERFPILSELQTWVLEKTSAVMTAEQTYTRVERQ